MVVQLECGARMRYKEMIAAIEGYEEISMKYLGQDKINPISMLFEVDCDDFAKVESIMHKLVKGTRYGKTISFRIVPYGQEVYYK